MTYTVAYQSEQLVHHGIKGMKWGVRRYQNEDGSLTSLGKARQRKIDAARAYSKGQYSDDAVKLYNKYNKAKGEFSDEKIKEKLAKQKNKSNHQLNLEQKYIDQGYTKQEAEIKAYQRVRNEKIFAGVAAATLVTAGAVAGYKIYQDRVDKVLKKDALLSRITTDSNRDLHDLFYASDKKADMPKYRGMYADAIQKNAVMQGFAKPDIFSKTIKTTGDIKVASNKNASDIFNNLLRTDVRQSNDFRSLLKDFKDFSDQNPGAITAKQRDIINKAYRDYNSGKTNRNIYNFYNFAINSGRNISYADSVRSKYQKALTSKGYDAISDLNDKKWSGYQSKNPLVFINNSKVVVSKVSKLTDSEIQSYKSKAESRILMESTLKESAKYLSKLGAAGAAVYGGSKIVSSRQTDKIVKEYRKDHPNSKLSYRELVERAQNGEL